MPAPIPDTPQNIALACMNGLPKRDWNYLKKLETKEDAD